MDQFLAERPLKSGAAAEATDLSAELAAVAPAPPGRDGPAVGVLAGFDERGVPLVLYPGAPGGRPVPARSVVALSAGAVGREAVLLFEQGDPARPLVMGLVEVPRPGPARVELDGERLVLTAEREITLRCGEASITLTSAGKVLIHGSYVLSRSSGLNRIKGGAVQIN
jgi:hypothetical protein